MRVFEAADRYAAFGVERGIEDLRLIDPWTLVDLMLTWYADERFDDVDPEASGDMLLFQWGTYSDGDGAATFEYDITRQLIDRNVGDDEDSDDDGAVWQLHVTEQFPAGIGSELGRGHRWCETPDDLPEFRTFIETSDATAAVRGAAPSLTEVYLDQAG
jgi:hypothetical protein